MGNIYTSIGLVVLVRMCNENIISLAHRFTNEVLIMLSTLQLNICFGMFQYSRPYCTTHENAHICFSIICSFSIISRVALTNSSYDVRHSLLCSAYSLVFRPLENPRYSFQVYNAQISTFAPYRDPAITTVSRGTQTSKILTVVATQPICGCSQVTSLFPQCMYHLLCQFFQYEGWDFNSGNTAIRIGVKNRASC